MPSNKTAEGKTKFVTTTRKFVIRPVESNFNNWSKRVIEFTKSYVLEQEKLLKEKKKYFEKRRVG